MQKKHPLLANSPEAQITMLAMNLFWINATHILLIKKKV